MKNIILISISLFTSLANGQSTYTLNTINDFSDFTINGSPNSGTITMQSSNFSPLSFSLACTGCYKTLTSPTYSVPTTCDSIVVTFSTSATYSMGIEIASAYPFFPPTIYPCNTTIRLTYPNTSTITIPPIKLLTANTSTPSSVESVSIFGLQVNGYRLIATKLNNLDALSSSYYYYQNTLYSKNKTIENLSFDIYDLTGKLIDTEFFENGKSKVNVAQVSNGFYLYTVIGKNNNILTSGKITVNK